MSYSNINNSFIVANGHNSLVIGCGHTSLPNSDESLNSNNVLHALKLIKKFI